MRNLDGMCISILALSNIPTPYLSLTQKRLHALPVVDAKHGNLVGIITAKDVMRDVIKTANKMALPAEDVSQMADINP